MAPRNGGVTNEAVTSARTVRRSGMSVRATSQPIGAATTQQMTADEVARMTVVISGLEEGRIGEERREVAEREGAALSVKL